MLEVKFIGPYSLKPIAGENTSIFADIQAYSAGVYIWTVMLEGRHWINYVGVAKDSIAGRQGTHLSCSLSGRYMFHDASKLSKGIREPIFYPSDGITKFVEKFDHLSTQLDNMSIFFAPIEEEFSVLQRIETRIIKTLMKADLKYNLLDNDRVSRYRKESEEEIEIRVTIPNEVQGIPNVLSA
jgi:hypothetical protein